MTNPDEVLADLEEKRNQESSVIGIDPGVSGAIVFQNHGGVSSEKMPGTTMDIWDHLHSLSLFGHPVAFIERVGGYMPGNSGPASVKFARHVGNLEMALIGNKIPFEWVTPSKWMTAFIGASRPKDKTKRKRAIKQRAQELYPDIRVTLANADALGILWWATRMHHG